MEANEERGDISLGRNSYAADVELHSTVQIANLRMLTSVAMFPPCLRLSRVMSDDARLLILLLIEVCRRS